ncbi:site-specific recombinase XerD [Pedobacter cryoconitis]|uniref:site-specific integrase n=1 Tax=Pedobacter cryoconitis TaxID=188932 RepID=UPI0016103289|nr:site-specific integrase [Pedobacter cryoconitis]MBB6273559.1 site-specific recombinase XerD [Pedobacter cryoconitis]
MKLSYSIKPVLRLDKKKIDGTCPIHFSVRVGPCTTRISSGKSILPQDWDMMSGKVKKTDKFNQALSVYLNSKVSGWEMYMLKQQSLGKPITLNVALGYLRGNAEITLFSFWAEQMRLWEYEKKSSTLSSYKSTLNILKLFNKNLNFGDLTYSCIQKFDLYLRKERNNATNGCFVKHKCLKHIIQEAIRKDYMDKNPYRDFKVRSEKVTRMFLSIDEVKALGDLKINDNNPFVERARDLFIFSCYTGLRYSDAVNLKWGDIKSNPYRIELKIIKTSKSLLIPLIPKAKEILDKYSKLTIRVDSQKILPQMANQVVNRNLKDIMKLAGINKNISFHCSRHSFASNLVELRVPLVYVKDLLGHQKIEQTMIYAKSLEGDLFDSMKALNEMYNHAV